VRHWHLRRLILDLKIARAVHDITEIAGCKKVTPSGRTTAVQHVFNATMRPVEQCQAPWHVHNEYPDNHMPKALFDFAAKYCTNPADSVRLREEMRRALEKHNANAGGPPTTGKKKKKQKKRRWLT
jgi:hypothetical protein